MLSFTRYPYIFAYDDDGKASVATHNSNGTYSDFIRCSALDFAGVASLTVDPVKSVAYIWTAAGECYKQRVFTDAEFKSITNPHGFPPPVRVTDLDFSTQKAEQRAMAIEAARKGRELKAELDAQALAEKRRADAEEAVKAAKTEAAARKATLAELKKETDALREAAGEFAPEPVAEPTQAEIHALEREANEAKRAGRRTYLNPNG